MSFYLQMILNTSFTDGGDCGEVYALWSIINFTDLNESYQHWIPKKAKRETKKTLSNLELNRDQ